MRSCNFLTAALVLLATVGSAQPTINLPNVDVDLYASGISASGESMNVDARGHVFIVDQQAGGPFISPHSITHVSPNGTVDPIYAPGVGVCSQIAFNPIDGACYVATHSPFLTVVLSQVWRLDPAAGLVPVGVTPLLASGFTIDDGGRWIFGSQTAVGGPGLYRQAGNGSPAISLGQGFGANRVLQSMASSQDILIADGVEVRRWTPLATAPIPYFSQTGFPNTVARVTSLTRRPFDQLGKGALIGVNDFNTLCPCGVGIAYSGEPTNASSAPVLAAESFASPSTGLRQIATSIRGRMFWLTDTPTVTPNAGKALYRVREQDGSGIPGSLQVQAQALPGGGVVNIDVWGPAGAPFLLGAITGLSSTANAEIYTPYGFILNLFDPGYVTVVDGAGVFGPPNPLGIIPPSGHWQFAITLPPLGISVASQALIDDASAPNGAFFISNVAINALP